MNVGTFSAPVFVTAPPGDGHRLMVVEKTGRIQILVDGVKQATPFLDISSNVTAPSGSEQGLLSMAFAPDYATSGKFYVYYTSKTCDGSGGCDEHVSEFTRSASNPNVANPSSERLLLDIPHPNQTNHNGGQLEFGPDGMLYIGTGDGGGSNDTEGNAQKTTDLLGKLLRIDPSHGSPYSIPTGNPFSGGLCDDGPNGGGDCPEIWSYGLRNPWRFSFDRANGDLVIGDVGQDNVEEIDYAHPGQNVGANYGWPCYEGTRDNHSAAGSSCPTFPLPSAVMPVFQYNHSGSGFTGDGIIGGYVVRDPSVPDLYGRYVYGDLASSGTQGLRSLALAQPNATDDRPVPVNVASLTSFGEDAAGCVYAASLSGGVWRLASSPTAPTTCPLSSSGSPPPPADRTPPTISISLRKRQRILRTHSIKLALRVNEPAAIAGTATVNVGSAARVLRFRRLTRTLAANKRTTMRLRLSKRTFKRLSAALQHKRSLVAKLTISARDAAGNLSSKRRAVRLIR